MSNKRTVVITGIGLLSPIGLDGNAVFESVCKGTSGISLFTDPLLNKSFPVGRINCDFEKHFNKLELPYLDRCQQLAVIAAAQAVQDANIPHFADYAQRAGLFYGTVNGGGMTELAWFRQFLLEGKQMASPYAAMAIMQNGGAAQISIRHQVQGPVMTHGSACTASGAAIGEAYRAISDGYLDVAIAGGAEAPIVPSVLSVFDGTRALAVPDPEDPKRSCKPFSSMRRGLVLGEGAVFFVLEAAEHAQRRQASCYGALTGYGIASDAFHIGQPHQCGQVAALRAALADARLEANQLDYVNAHATATARGDEVEATALREVIGTGVPVSSTKALHGHLLGATSALELAITVMALQESILPATANLTPETIDSGCDLYHVPGTTLLDYSIEHALSFSCGFGGTNVALVVSKHRELPGKAVKSGAIT